MLYDALGLVRTEELPAAVRYQGVDQLFKHMEAHPYSNIRQGNNVRKQKWTRAAAEWWTTELVSMRSTMAAGATAGYANHLL